MRNTNNQYGFAVTHTLLVSGVIIGVVLIAAFVSQQAAISKQKKIYDEAEQQITAFVNEAAKLAPSTKEIKKYCSYSSAKYGKGYLSCMISSTASYSKTDMEGREKVISGLYKIQERLKWTYVGDNTKKNVTNSSLINIKIYQYKQLSCNVSVSYKSTDPYGKNFDKTLLVMESSCMGMPNHEIFPV